MTNIKQESSTHCEQGIRLYYTWRTTSDYHVWSRGNRQSICFGSLSHSKKQTTIINWVTSLGMRSLNVLSSMDAQFRMKAWSYMRILTWAETEGKQDVDKPTQQPLFLPLREVMVRLSLAYFISSFRNCWPSSIDLVKDQTNFLVRFLKPLLV